MPALPDEARALHRVLEHCRRNLDLWIDLAHPLAHLADKPIYLVNAIVVKEIAHVGWTTRDSAPVQDIVGHLASIALGPVGGNHSRVAPPVGLYALLNVLNAKALGARLVAEHRMARNVFQAIVAEAISLRRHVTRIAHVV